MLLWNRQLWLIDHGAALYFHHSWQDWEQQASRPFGRVKDHVLLPRAMELDAVDTIFRNLLTPEKIRAIVGCVPDDWLADDSPFASISQHREAYIRFLEIRVAHSPIFVKDAQYARSALV